MSALAPGRLPFHRAGRTSPRACSPFSMFLVAATALPALVPAQIPRGPGPWDGDIALYRSADGQHFQREATLVEGGGVPTLLADSRGRLAAAFQWFPRDDEAAFDRVAVSFSTDGGETWSSPRTIEISGLPEDLVRPFDPTLVEAPGGRYRLYFTSRPAPGPGNRRQGEPAIYSALSGDAIGYRFEPGARFRVEGSPVIDCAAARLGESWHLFAPVQGEDGKAYHAVSADGLRFRRLPDLDLPGGGSWLGCALAVEGGLRFWGSGRNGPWCAFSEDALAWRLVPDTRGGGADPGVARLPSGGYLMVATELRRRPEPRGGRRPPQAEEGPSFAGGRIAANDQYVYVLQGGRLYQFDARTLELLRSVPVAPPGGPQRRYRPQRR